MRTLDRLISNRPLFRDEETCRIAPLYQLVAQIGNSMEDLTVSSIDRSHSGAGCKEIAKLLNEEGFRSANGGRWGKVTVHKVLTNEAYAGRLVWGGRAGHPAAKSGDPPVRVEDAWPVRRCRENWPVVDLGLPIRARSAAATSSADSSSAVVEVL